jgi:hypothetical protein
MGFDWFYWFVECKVAKVFVLVFCYFFVDKAFPISRIAVLRCWLFCRKGLKWGNVKTGSLVAMIRSKVPVTLTPLDTHEVTTFK